MAKRLMLWCWYNLHWWSKRKTYDSTPKSCTGYQSPSESSTRCACCATNRGSDTRRSTSRTYWHQLPMYQHDVHCALRYVSTLSYRALVDESATEPSLSLHHEHGTGCGRGWNSCSRPTPSAANWKHFCFTLSTDTRERADGSVMRPRSFSRRRNIG